MSIRNLDFKAFYNLKIKEPIRVLFNQIGSFKRATSGNVILSASLLTPILLGAAGYTADYAIIYHEKAKLQDAADAAALASVRELRLAGAKRKVIKNVAKSYVKGTFSRDQKVTNGTSSIETKTKVSFKKKTVTVDLAYTWQPFMAHLFDKKALPIRVSATATLAGEALTCVVGLMDPQTLAKASIHIDNKAKIKADNCAVYSNSTSRFGLRADAKARMIAGSICSAGGVYNSGILARASFKPDPVTDCPKIKDPLIDRKPPSYSACNFKNKTISKDEELKEGVYCGGLRISGSASVTLSPGIYVIKDGPLIVEDKASISAKGITFYLTGEKSVFRFTENSKIDLEATETGPTAGILFFEDRNVPHSFEFNPDIPPLLISSKVRIHHISSNYARNLLGTLYLSKSILLIDSEAAVADVSAYTAIITGRLWLQEGPTLYLNADLDATTVPAPEGLIGQRPTLIK